MGHVKRKKKKKERSKRTDDNEDTFNLKMLRLRPKKKILKLKSGSNHL